MNNYKTTFQYARTEFIEKKSKFISSVKPVETEEEAIQFINDIKKEFYDARHNVFAYQIGLNNEIQRCSDDGEPSGTSGAPTLDVLRKNDIKNTVIVTTRYFGGILLGTGGLVRAYGKSASLAIEEAKVIEKVLFDKMHITCDYTLSGKISYVLAERDINILDTFYTDSVTYEVLFDTSMTASLSKYLIDITNNNILIEKINSEFYKLYQKKVLLE